MSATEPELYLRLLGERTLRTHDPQRHWGQGNLGEAASALVAVGALPLAVAVAVVDDYQLAVGLRGDRHARMMHAQPPTAPVTEAPTAPVVAVCRRSSSPPDPGPADGWAWDVHQVVFGDPETVLTVSSTTAPPWERADQGGWVFGHPHRGQAHPGQAGTLTLGDDTGHLEQADFSGGGGGDRWSGQYRTNSPLSPTTRWLEFDGRRLELLRPASLPTVRVEDHGSGGPAERHLRHLLAAGTSRHGDDDERLDAAVDALVATGVLDPDAPVRAELAAVRAARAAGGFPPGFVRPGGGARSSTARTAALPEAWDSVFRVAPAAGPVGVLPLGVATPVVDGAAVVFRALTSAPGEFSVDTHQVGGETSQRFGDHVERTPAVAWWAQDDLGHWYHGAWSGWSGGEDGMTGDVQYEPPLDPRARTLRLLPTLPSRRAVVEIALPEWGAAR